MYLCAHACMCMHSLRFTLYTLRMLLLDRLGVRVSRAWLSRMFRRWRWSFKKLNHKHVDKYTPRNIAYYGQYLAYIRTVPMNRIKYMDEASFSSRGMNAWIDMDGWMDGRMDVDVCYVCVCVCVCV